MNHAERIAIGATREPVQYTGLGQGSVTVVRSYRCRRGAHGQCRGVAFRDDGPRLPGEKHLCTCTCGHQRLRR